MSAPVAALPEGAKVDDFHIVRRLGRGGFGITYLATEFAPVLGQPGQETALRQVALKEYFPHGLAQRDEALAVQPVLDVDGAQAAFDSGLKAFLQEARTIALFDHENIVRVHRVFEANATAYFTMPYLKGESLGAILKRERTLSEERCRRLILPVIDGLAYAHRHGVLHRDVKPPNVMIREDDGRPVLIDFGNARVHTAVDAIQLTQMTDLMSLTPGYAALEQYARSTKENPQGPYTDVYALAAMLHRAALGQDPPEATVRASEVYSGRPDPLIPISLRLGGNPAYSRSFLAAIDWGLELAAADRPQSLEEFREVLDGKLSRRSRRAQRGASISVDSEPDLLLEPGTVPIADAIPDSLEPTHITPWTAPRTITRAQPDQDQKTVVLAPEPTVVPQRADPAGAVTKPSRSVRMRLLAAGAVLAVLIAPALLVSKHPASAPASPPVAAPPVQPQAAAAPAANAPAAAPQPAPAPPEDPVVRRHRLAQEALHGANAAMAGNRRRDAAAAYGKALELEPSLQNDPTLAANLVACLSYAADLAEPLIKRYPSEAVIDALSKRSGEQGTMRAQRAIALLTALHRSDKIDSSYLVGAAIADYKGADTCEAKLAVLPRLRALHDPRAIPVLEASIGSGIGAWFKTRCYRDQVQDAIEEIGKASPAGPR